MTWLDGIAGLAFVGLFAYLAYALFNAEKF